MVKQTLKSLAGIFHIFCGDFDRLFCLNVEKSNEPLMATEVSFSHLCWYKTSSQITDLRSASPLCLNWHLQEPRDSNLILIEHYSYNLPWRPPACVNDHLFIDLWLICTRFSRGLRFLGAPCRPLACPWSESILKLRHLTSSRINTRSPQMERIIPISPAPIKILNCPTNTDLSGL